MLAPKTWIPHPNYTTAALAFSSGPHINKTNYIPCDTNDVQYVARVVWVVLAKIPHPFHIFTLNVWDVGHKLCAILSAAEQTLENVEIMKRQFRDDSFMVESSWRNVPSLNGNLEIGKVNQLHGQWPHALKLYDRLWETRSFHGRTFQTLFYGFRLIVRRIKHSFKITQSECIELVTTHNRYADMLVEVCAEKSDGTESDVRTRAECNRTRRKLEDIPTLAARIVRWQLFMANGVIGQLGVCAKRNACTLIHSFANKWENLQNKCWCAKWIVGVRILRVCMMD